MPSSLAATLHGRMHHLADRRAPILIGHDMSEAPIGQGRDLADDIAETGASESGGSSGQHLQISYHRLRRPGRMSQLVTADDDRRVPDR